MRRDQLEHAIRAACRILETTEVIIVGSQSVLGTWHDEELPPRATLSNEADIMAIDIDNATLIAKADLLEGAAGELSLFHHTHGFYIDGADLTTSVLPSSWRDRLVPLRGANTDYATGWCLDPHDLCVAKLIAHREKDIAFVQSLIDSRHISTATLSERCSTISPTYRERATRAKAWLSAH